MLAAACALMAQGPEFNADGKLMRPNYREWIYLSSGLGMTYSAEAKSQPSFDNVFVSPASYREFLATGRWPEKTMFVPRDPPGFEPRFHQHRRTLPKRRNRHRSGSEGFSEVSGQMGVFQLRRQAGEPRIDGPDDPQRLSLSDLSRQECRC